MNRLLYRAMRVLERVLAYDAEAGATCPVCGIRLKVTSTAYRDHASVKRRHKCERCDWNFSSVEDLTAQTSAVERPQEQPRAAQVKPPGKGKDTATLPRKGKPCQDKIGKRT